MNQSIDREAIYQELRRRAVVEFGERRAADLEDFLQTAAQQVADVEQADAGPDVEPMLQA